MAWQCIQIVFSFRHHQRGSITVHMMDIDLLLGNMRKIPPDDVGLRDAQLLRQPLDEINGILFGRGGDHGMLDVRERLKFLDRNLGVCLADEPQIPKQQVIGTAIE